ncbi:MAG: YicC/YloC family endoribonuclease [Spirosomataceae bacterium]
MIKSMTGFGKATVETENLSVTVEIKTLNSKFTDIFCRLPRTMSRREIEVRNYLTQALERGKIELNLSFQRTNAASLAVINRALLSSYINELEACVEENTLSGVHGGDLLKIALDLPDVLNTNAAQSEEEAEAEWKQILSAIEQAAKTCNQFRIREGEVVKQIFKDCITAIAERLDKVKEQDVLRIPAVRERLRKSVTDLLQDESFDQNRFEQELIYYIERFDISEEKVRLATHLSYFIEVLEKEGSGKKLNFISQEIGREINTIGSKANDALIQRYVVEMKDELEKIKEQTANVL